MKALLTSLLIVVCSFIIVAQPNPPSQAITKKITITREDGLQVAAPLIVAALAFISAAASLIVSSISSIRLKEREYRNDYFKKVIEKRLEAIKSIEDTTAPLRLYYITKNPDGSESIYHDFFTRPEKREAFKDAVAKTSEHVIWHSQSTAEAFKEFAKRVSKVIRECKELSELESRKVAVAEFENVSRIMNTLHKSISQDMLSLYKVEDFFQNKLKKLD